MGKNLYWLSDREWSLIEPLLPKGRRGAHRVDERRVISGIMHMLRERAGETARRPMARTRPSTTGSIAGAAKASGQVSSTR